MPTAAPSPCPVCAVPVPGGGKCPTHRSQTYRQTDRHRAEREPWRRVYHTPQWSRLRKQVLREQPVCASPGCQAPSVDVDHIVALQDGGAPYDRANLQALCKRHHGQKTKADRMARKQEVQPVTANWIVAGPPCSGKTTWAQQQTPGRVLDFDALFAEITGLDLYDQPKEHRAVVDAEFRSRLEGFTGGSIIRMAPRKQHRAVLRRIHHAQSVVLAVAPETCLARLAASDRPEEVKAVHAAAIHRWWADYQPGHDNLVLV